MSFPAASAALGELRQAGIVTTTSLERGATAYAAREVLDVIALPERALASAKSDTRPAFDRVGRPRRLRGMMPRTRNQNAELACSSGSLGL